MPRLRCSDYGFGCEFIIEADDIAKVIVEYSKHSEEEHGIEYSKEALMQFILRMGWEQLVQNDERLHPISIMNDDIETMYPIRWRNY